MCTIKKRNSFTNLYRTFKIYPFSKCYLILDTYILYTKLINLGYKETAYNNV